MNQALVAGGTMVDILMVEVDGVLRKQLTAACASSIFPIELFWPEMASRHSYKENIAGSIAKSEVDPQSRKLINLLGGC